MKNKRYLNICFVMLVIAVMFTACKAESNNPVERSSIVRPDTIKKEIPSGSDDKESNTKSYSTVIKPDKRTANTEKNQDNEVVPKPDENQANIEEEPSNNAGNQEGKVRTNLVTSDLEYDKLPEGWEAIGSVAADVSAYYGYMDNSSPGEPKAAIYIDSFDGEKRYNTEAGVKERLQERHTGDGLKNLTVLKSGKGIFEYTYSFATENDSKEYTGYVFEDQGATWEIGFYEDGSLNSTDKEKLKADFNKMVNSCRMVEIEGDVA